MNTITPLFEKKVSKPNTGLFVTFEGVEGCGKSTQARLLTEYLTARGIDNLLTREPGGPAISEAIRKLLLDPDYKEMLPETEMLLYMASRSQHTGEWILPAIKQGKVVISDRYYDSTIAYQGAARQLDYGIIDTLTGFATYNTEPDLTFLIDVPVQIGRDRIKSRALDRLEQETMAFHEKVRAQYFIIAHKHAYRYHVINGNHTISQIHEQIVQQMIKCLAK